MLYLKMKSAPHLEPQRWQRILEHIADAKRKENTSAPQSAILTQTAQGFQPRGFQNHIPARGRKQLAGQGVCCRPRGISKPHPRKGTETSKGVAIKSLTEAFDFKTTSPQGDGNVSCGRSPIRTRYFKTTSPQGDGNTLLPLLIHFYLLLFQNHIPARGRKHTIIGSM